MWSTLRFGAVASSALVIGAAIRVRFKLAKRLLAMLLAVAAGALITASASGSNDRVQAPTRHFDLQMIPRHPPHRMPVAVSSRQIGREIGAKVHIVSADRCDVDSVQVTTSLAAADRLPAA